MDKEHYYVNVDLKELIKYLREIRIPEEDIKLIIGYCVKRRDEELEEVYKNGVR